MNSRLLASLALAAWAFGGPSAPASAQSADAPLNLQWWHPVAAGAGVATLLLIDEPIQNWIQDDHQSGWLDEVTDVTKDFKSPKVFYATAGGALAIGLIAKRPKVTATGAQIIAAYGLSSGIMVATKWAFGRSRPSSTPDDPTGFDWFNGGQSSAFPSGSAAVVFSLATTLADAVDRKPVSIALYTAAVLNAYARVYNNRHWVSDVALGALYGVAAAKVVNGEWTVFGLELPAVWTDGRSTSLGYTVTW